MDMSITGWAGREVEGMEVAWCFKREHTVYLACMCVGTGKRLVKDSRGYNGSYRRHSLSKAFTPERRHGRRDGP
jgi:hypothetical protein